MYARLLRLIISCGWLVLSISGCGRSPQQTTDPQSNPAVDHVRSDSPSANPKNDERHTHSHDRGAMLIADVGKYHALLTAHLSRVGNELDLFFETPVEESPKAVALPLSSIEALATAGDGQTHALTFEPAPPEERPQDETQGTCSHFVAKASWMKSEDKLRVVARFMVDGEELKANWNNFEPQRYAHHRDE